MIQTFKPRVYGRTELAQLYCPYMEGQSAYRKMKKWLAVNPRLEHLCHLRSRCYTPAQVALIVSEIGEP